MRGKRKIMGIDLNCDAKGIVMKGHGSDSTTLNPVSEREGRLDTFFVPLWIGKRVAVPSPQRHPTTPCRRVVIER